MIIYGTGTKDLGTKKLSGAKCSNCQSSNMHIHGAARYFSLFWIPVFPFSKKLVVFCDDCQRVFNKKELDTSTKDKLGFEKKSFKIPTTLFSGVMIIAAFVLYALYDGYQKNQSLGKELKSLSAGQVIVFSESSNSYSFGKVSEVAGDTIFINFSNYVYEGGVPTHSRYLKEKNSVRDFYQSQLRYYLQSDLDSLYAVDKIERIYK